MADKTDVPRIETISPAAHCEPLDAPGKAWLHELPWCGKINLRGRADDEQFMRIAGEVLQLALPPTVNNTSTGGGNTVFALGPNEWLAHCPIKKTETLLRQLAEKLGRAHYAATDVSDYTTVIAVGGEHAGAMLARGCPLDLHPREFKPGQCAQTRLGNASILLHRPDDQTDADAETVFHLQVRWSFTGYVWNYLAQAAAFL